MPQCKENRPSILKPPCAKHLGLGFVLFCFLITPPHNLKLLHVLIIQFQNTKLLLHRVLMKRPTQLDNHRFCHERAARCPPPSLLFPHDIYSWMKYLVGRRNPCNSAGCSGPLVHWMMSDGACITLGGGELKGGLCGHLCKSV